jgi:hypothetical protein
MQILPHELYDAAIPVGSLIIGGIGLMIRSAIVSAKEELKVQINTIGGKIDVHVAEDRIIHDGMNKRVDKVESSIDRIEQRNDRIDNRPR